MAENHIINVDKKLEKNQSDPMTRQRENSRKNRKRKPMYAQIPEIFCEKSKKQNVYIQKTH